MGFSTRLTSTPLGRIISASEAHPDPGVIDFGFLLLALSEKATVGANKGINRIAELARRDGQIHDLSLGFDSPKSGFTVHCTAEPVSMVGNHTEDVNLSHPQWHSDFLTIGSNKRHLRANEILGANESLIV
jgi:hypothetical protein